MKLPLTLAAGFLTACLSAQEGSPPKLVDDRFELSIFAENPEIVTPIGIAADRRGRVFVVESHTHEVKEGYSGHGSDRVKIFEGGNTGKAQKVSVFADGFRAEMNLAFGPGEELYLVQRDKVLRLPDENRDGKADRTVELLTLKTEESYPHNGLDGIVFGPDGWMYIGLGENLGRKYTLRGSDGAEYTGGGEGGNVFRCQPDGTHLELYATGFWNPFALEFSREGDLFAVDNDPDGRPPSRLLHVVRGGDYGYQFRYGRSGLHPFVAWDGELPGTLGMASGTGEAPSGILRCVRAGWPKEYRDSLLVTAWGDNTLEIYPLAHQGASYRSVAKIFARGDASFRPVGVAAIPYGDVFITDWADKSYPVHGKGRIWRLRYKGEREPIASEYLAIPPEKQRLRKLQEAGGPDAFDELLLALKDEDPFIRSAAIFSLAKTEYQPRVLAMSKHPDPPIRLGLLLALRKAGATPPADLLKESLNHSDEQIRRMAAVWIGENGLVTLRKELDAMLRAGGVSPSLFATYLAAVQLLEAAESQEKPGSVWDAGLSAKNLIERLLQNPNGADDLKLLALAMAPEGEHGVPTDLLLRFLSHPEEEMRAQALLSLGRSTDPTIIPHLEQVARDTKQPAELRADATAALAEAAPLVKGTLVRLAEETVPVIQAEAVRALATLREEEKVVQLLKRVAAETKLPEIRERAQIALGEGKARRDEDWMKLAGEQKGDPRAGRRLFFHASLGCIQCHKVQGRGGNLGPDLTFVARSMDRRKLAESILEPSRDVAPHFVAHEFELKDGQVVSGLVLSRTPAEVMVGARNVPARRIAADELESERSSTISFMPEGLEENLTAGDFQDMLAFLETLR